MLILTITYAAHLPSPCLSEYIFMLFCALFYCRPRLPFRFRTDPLHLLPLYFIRQSFYPSEDIPSFPRRPLVHFPSSNHPSPICRFFVFCLPSSVSHRYTSNLTASSSYHITVQTVSAVPTALPARSQPRARAFSHTPSVVANSSYSFFSSASHSGFHLAHLYASNVSASPVTYVHLRCRFKSTGLHPYLYPHKEPLQPFQLFQLRPTRMPHILFARSRPIVSLTFLLSSSSFPRSSP